jgi:hypothetical protein
MVVEVLDMNSKMMKVIMLKCIDSLSRRPGFIINHTIPI